MKNKLQNNFATHEKSLPLPLPKNKNIIIE